MTTQYFQATVKPGIFHAKDKRSEQNEYQE